MKRAPENEDQNEDGRYDDLHAYRVRRAGIINCPDIDVTMPPYLQLITFVFGLIAALNAFAGLFGKIEEFWRSRARFGIHARKVDGGGFELVLVNVGATPAQDVLVKAGPGCECVTDLLRRDMFAAKDEVVIVPPDGVTDTMVVVVRYRDVAKRTRTSRRVLARGPTGFHLVRGDDVAHGITLERRFSFGDRARLPRF